MDAEEQAGTTGTATPTGTTQDDRQAEKTRPPDWWHRDHPTFTALTGFFTGLLFVIIVPGTFVALLRALVDYDTAEELFPLVLVTLVVPLGLVIAPRTRRFGWYMLIGIVSTAVVVVGTAALVVWYLYASDS